MRGLLSLQSTLVVSALAVHFLQSSATIFGLYSFRLINPNFSPALNHSLVFNITFNVEAHDEILYFILERNEELVPHDRSVQVLSTKGHVKDVYDLDHGVQYVRGAVWIGKAQDNSEEVGWARLAMVRNSTKVLLTGTFTILQNQYVVEPQFADDGSALMVSTKQEQEHGLDKRCAASPDYHLLKRQSWDQWGDGNLVANIGNPDGCPTTRRIAYIGIMTDCSFTASFDSADSAHHYIMNMVNTASVVFESSFNISLGVRNLTISDAECPNSSSVMTAWNAPCTQGDLNTRLQTFSRWRSSIVDTNAYWTLLTGCSVSAGEIGVSWMGSLCDSGDGYSNGGASANVVARTQSEWQVFAHESGHIFGAVHDCTADTCRSDASQCCPLSSNTCNSGGQYIMNPVSEQSMTRFSPCTIGNVCSGLGSNQVDSSCLVEAQTGNTEQCGNGIVESGESCDCGNGACDERETQCCDSVTCQYRQVDGCNRSSTGNNGNTNDGYSQGSGSPSSWTQRHLSLIIGVCAGVGGALLLLFFGCLLCSCRRIRRTKGGNVE